VQVYLNAVFNTGIDRDRRPSADDHAFANLIARVDLDARMNEREELTARSQYLLGDASAAARGADT
jgi:hypothetical protein